MDIFLIVIDNKDDINIIGNLHMFGLFSIRLTASGWISQSVTAPQVSSKKKCELRPLKQE